MPIGRRRVVVASATIAVTGTTQALDLAPDVAATEGYLKARNSNVATIRIGRDNDLSNEPFFSLAAGETLPIQLEIETDWFIRGTANDVVEFVGDAPE